jgi:uncharacterized protein (TIGR00369 family)
MFTGNDFLALVAEGLPQTRGTDLAVADWQPGEVTLRLPFNEASIRPGGTISGPTLFSLADIALYGVVLSRIGHVELAVTTNLNINFLRRPEPADLLARARLLKLGTRLAVGEVAIWRDAVDGGPDRAVAHATGTYSIPPGGREG